MVRCLFVYLIPHLSCDLSTLLVFRIKNLNFVKKHFVNFWFLNNTQRTITTIRFFKGGGVKLEDSDKESDMLYSVKSCQFYEEM